MENSKVFARIMDLRKEQITSGRRDPSRITDLEQRRAIEQSEAQVVPLIDYLNAGTDDERQARQVALFGLMHLLVLANPVLGLLLISPADEDGEAIVEQVHKEVAVLDTPVAQV
jgi:hypothetical protein